MNFVEPIRDRKRIAQIKNLLRGQGRFRDLLLFVVGVNTALRISDVLRLRIGDFLDEKRRIRRRFWIREQKRGKRQEVVVNESIRAAFMEYLGASPEVAQTPEHFVFFNTKTRDYTQPIKRGQAWKFMRAVCGEIGFPGNYGTHSLRKTWGYYARQLLDFSLPILDSRPSCGIVSFMVNNSPESLDVVFSSLSDPTRRAIIERLARGEASVTELAAPFDMSLPAISKHLRILERAGLIARERQGRIHHMRLTASAMKDAAEWLGHYRRFWEDQLDSLAAYLDHPDDQKQAGASDEPIES